MYKPTKLEQLMRENRSKLTIDREIFRAAFVGLVSARNDLSYALQLENDKERERILNRVSFDFETSIGHLDRADITEKTEHPKRYVRILLCGILVGLLLSIGLMP